jgi:hypothetical protein
MPDEEKQCYELVKHNVRHPDPSTTTVVGTVRGPGRALRAVEVLDARLTTEEREAGFRHYTRKSERFRCEVQKAGDSDKWGLLEL